MDEPLSSTTNPDLPADTPVHAPPVDRGGARASVPPPPPDRLPGSVAWLGYGGLAPFLALAAGAVLAGMHADLCRAALFSYAAVILSFVGALHWGIALTAPQLEARQRAGLYGWSVVPALLAWPALLVYAEPATFILIGGFIAHYWQDVRLVRKTAAQRLLPGWYLPLRLQLTVVACICIAAGGLGGAR